MFRVEIFVDDAKLPRVLHAMTGLVLGQPNIQPVANATVGKDGAVVPRVTNGDRIKILAQHLRKSGIKEVQPADIKAFAVAHGLAESSYSLILKQAIEYGVLKKKRGAKGKYEVAR